MKEQVVQERNKLISNYSNSNPIDLNSLMNTVYCGLCIKHENLSLLPHLMCNARELVHSYRICLLFMLMCNISLCAIQILTSMLFLPPIFSEFQVSFF